MRWFAAGLLMALPGMAQAVEVLCSFETECFEAEACDEAAFEMRLQPGKSAGTTVVRSPSETIVGAVGGDDSGALTWFAASETAVHLLSWGTDGAARYTLHLLEGPAMLSYVGSCEAE